MSILRTIVPVCALAFALPAAAEDVAPSASEAQKPAGDLFEALAAADSAPEARVLEMDIYAHWAHTESPSEALLLKQASALAAEGAFKQALEKLDALTEVAPDYVEGWSLRALVQRKLDRPVAAISDLGRVLEIEPKHFRALMLLGSIFEEMNQPKSALKAWEAALEINPYLEGGAAAVRRLTNELKGRGI